MDIDEKEKLNERNFTNLRETKCAEELLRIRCEKDREYQYNFLDSKKNYMQKLAAYKLGSIRYDIDGCEEYKSKEICELYAKLWSDLIKISFQRRRPHNEELKYSFGGHDSAYQFSGETLISATAALKRCKEKNSWNYFLNVDNTQITKEMDNFAYWITTMGNYMPIPKSRVNVLVNGVSQTYCMQKILTDLDERFDKELKIIKAYYLDDRDSLDTENEKKYYDFLVAIKEHKKNVIYYWLDSFGPSESCGQEKWKCFVEKNYLNGSFVNSQGEVIEYKDTLEDLTERIYIRTCKMTDELEKL